MKKIVILMMVMLLFCYVGQGQILPGMQYAQPQQPLTPQQLDSLLSTSSVPLRQAIIMQYWRTSLIANATGNYALRAHLSNLESVIRKYDPLYHQHGEALVQTLLMARGGGQGRPMSRMPVFDDGGGRTVTQKQCGGFGRLSCKGSHICMLCMGTGTCQGYDGSRFQCTACHGGGKCSFH